MMGSFSTSRVAVSVSVLALAISLFLSSKDVIVNVESFSPSKSSFTPRSQAMGVGVGVGLPSSSASRSISAAFHSQFQLLATPETKFGERLGLGESYNETATTATATESLANSASIAEAERAWTLDDGNGMEIELVEALESATTATAADADSTTNSFLSADVIGPLASIAFVIVFLCHTLLNSGGISDTFVGMDLSHKMNILKEISWLPGQFQEAQLVVGLVMAFSAFAQALTGFGFAVVAVGAMSSMPWLLHSELYDVITPVAATLGALVGFILLIPYAFASGPKTEDEPGLEWNEILPLLIPCTILTPLGIQLNSMVDPLIGTRVLAALIMGFVAYKLVPMIQDAIASSSSDDNEEDALIAAADADDASPDFLQSKTAAILFGSAAGIFGGAFDVQGPPLCIYGDAKGWSPAQFRNNVLAVVCLNSAFVVAIDSFQGALGDFYYSYFCLTSLPGVLLGVLAGQYASARIDPVLFKNLVLVMCLGLGIQLLTVS